MENRIIVAGESGWKHATYNSFETQPILAWHIEPLPDMILTTPITPDGEQCMGVYGHAIVSPTGVYFSDEDGKGWTRVGDRAAWLEHERKRNDESDDPFSAAA